MAKKDRIKSLLKKDDNVVVIAGRDKGKKGKILAIDPQKERVIVEGVNNRKEFRRPSQENPKGGVVNIEAPMHISNVMYYDDKQKKGVRLGQVREQNKKHRVIRTKDGQQKKID